MFIINPLNQTQAPKESGFASPDFSPFGRKIVVISKALYCLTIKNILAVARYLFPRLFSTSAISFKLLKDYLHVNVQHAKGHFITLFNDVHGSFLLSEKTLNHFFDDRFDSERAIFLSKIELPSEDEALLAAYVLFKEPDRFSDLSESFIKSYNFEYVASFRQDKIAIPNNKIGSDSFIRFLEKVNSAPTLYPLLQKATLCSLPKAKQAVSLLAQKTLFEKTSVTIEEIDALRDESDTISRELFRPVQILLALRQLIKD